MTEQKTWRKILYEDQGVADNYVDETFLQEMKKNLYNRKYDFWTVVKGSSAVTQHIYCVCIFVCTYVYMYTDTLSPQLLFIISSVVTVLGYLLNLYIDHSRSNASINSSSSSSYSANSSGGQDKSVFTDIKSAVVFLLFGYGLSPILMTLTRTISTDTVYAMTFCMLLINILFYDYESSLLDPSGMSRAVSFNASIFAAVCLASRLKSTWHAFATVTFAVEIFALWPVLRKSLKASQGNVLHVLDVLIGSCVLLMIGSISTVACLLFIIVHIFITIICPALLIRLQPYKNNIYGPWDEATIRK